MFHSGFVSGTEVWLLAHFVDDMPEPFIEMFSGFTIKEVSFWVVAYAWNKGICKYLGMVGIDEIPLITIGFQHSFSYVLYMKLDFGIPTLIGILSTFCSSNTTSHIPYGIFLRKYGYVFIYFFLV